MRTKKINPVSEERVCKKCGEPLISTSKYKCCDNCRRERTETCKGVFFGLVGSVLAFLGGVPVVKHFVKKN